MATRRHPRLMIIQALQSYSQTKDAPSLIITSCNGHLNACTFSNNPVSDKFGAFNQWINNKTQQSRCFTQISSSVKSCSQKILIGTLKSIRREPSLSNVKILLMKCRFSQELLIVIIRECSAQGQVLHCKRRNQGCSSVQRQVFHRKHRNQGCSFARDK